MEVRKKVVCKKNNMSLDLSKDHKPHLFDEKSRIKKLGGKIYFDGYDYIGFFWIQK